MTISELFEKIQDEFLPEELNGEFQLQTGSIVWTYNLNNDSEEIDYTDNEEEDNMFNFDSTSPEELLRDAYDEDLEMVQEFLDEIEEGDNWKFSDPETVGNIISFKIF